MSACTAPPQPRRPPPPAALTGRRGDGGARGVTRRLLPVERRDAGRRVPQARGVAQHLAHSGLLARPVGGRALHAGAPGARQAEVHWVQVLGHGVAAGGGGKAGVQGLVEAEGPPGSGRWHRLRMATGGGPRGTAPPCPRPMSLPVHSPPHLMLSRPLASSWCRATASIRFSLAPVGMRSSVLMGAVSSYEAVPYASCGRQVAGRVAQMNTAACKRGRGCARPARPCRRRLPPSAPLAAAAGAAGAAGVRAACSTRCHDWPHPTGLTQGRPSLPTPYPRHAHLVNLVSRFVAAGHHASPQVEVRQLLQQPLGCCLLLLASEGLHMAGHGRQHQHHHQHPSENGPPRRHTGAVRQRWGPVQGPESSVAARAGRGDNWTPQSLGSAERLAARATHTGQKQLLGITAGRGLHSDPSAGGTVCMHPPSPGYLTGRATACEAGWHWDTFHQAHKAACAAPTSRPSQLP